MQYIHRDAERKFLKMNSFFKAILITGARQVGKTTMLKHLAQGTNRTYVSLDNLQVRQLAQSDPILFFQTFRPPVIIDEIQYAPELFPYIKILCDETEEKGLFWLTGSQQYAMIKNVRESLAGRIGILELYSLSQREKSGVQFDEQNDFSLETLIRRQKELPPNNVRKVFAHIWEGGMPQAVGADGEMRAEYFNSYIDSYLMRDVSELGKITDSGAFSKFFMACAALIGQQVKYNTLAESAGISEPTAKSWLLLLESLGIVYLLKPYSHNALKRLTKTPKLYFCDTGLCAYLSMWLTADTLREGAASGAFYENYVVMELVKNYAYAKERANITYYRDANANEIDVFIEEGQIIHPLEIKKSAMPDVRAVKKYQLLDKAALQRGNGGIVCMCDAPLPIDEKNCYIPSNLL